MTFCLVVTARILSKAVLAMMSWLGGSGGDVFVFSGGGGHDVILDFEAGDMLQISSNINNTGISSAADVAARATQVGSHTVVDLGQGDTLTLNNVDVDDMQENPDSYFAIS